MARHGRNEVDVLHGASLLRNVEWADGTAGRPQEARARDAGLCRQRHRTRGAYPRAHGQAALGGARHGDGTSKHSVRCRLPLNLR